MAQVSSYLSETDNGYTPCLWSACSLHIFEITDSELDRVDWRSACDKSN